MEDNELKKFYYKHRILIVILILLIIVALLVNGVNAYGYYETWNGSLGVNTGYNTNEFSLDGSGEIGYNDFGVVAGGHYVHNNMMYGYSGLNYNPTDNLTMNFKYDYYPNSDSRNSKYNNINQYNIGASYDFDYVDVSSSYSFGSDGDWINTTVSHEIDNGWNTYGYYNYSLDGYDDRIGVGIKYEYKK